MAEPSFSQIFARWKDEYGWSDDRVAKRTGVHRTTVAALRLGKQTPQPRTVETYCAKLPGFAAVLQAMVGGYERFLDND